ncbi:hypothetical protein QY886_00755 [Latilactobacillus sakei]
MMTKEQTLMVLQVLKRKLQGLRIFRVIEELFSLYIIIKVFTADSQVNLLGVNFTEGRAIELMVLLLVIEFCLTRIQTNYKRSRSTVNRDFKRFDGTRKTTCATI